jgi:hypothetical protein
MSNQAYGDGRGCGGQRRTVHRFRTGPPHQMSAGEWNEALWAQPAKAESEPATWPPAMAESKRNSAELSECGARA